MSLALEKTDLARHVSIWQKQGKLLWVEGPTLQAGVDDMGGCERLGGGDHCRPQLAEIMAKMNAHANAL